VAGASASVVTSVTVPPPGAAGGVNAAEATEKAKKPAAVSVKVGVNFIYALLVVSKKLC
jgi:hypothetical protein